MPLEVVEHPWPAPLDDLWRRPDLGAAFMCGLPLTGFDPPPQIVAAPVPRGARTGGRAVYFTDFVGARESGFETLADCRGRTIALTTAGSHSGYNAVRYHLATRYSGARLFAHAVGPCDTPRRAVDAVIDGRADVAAVDSWAYALMARHAPDLAAPLRVVESTVAAPIPPLVAAHGIDPKVVANLTDAFLAVGAAPELRDVCADLEIDRFERVQREDYDVLPERRAIADRAGVPDLL